MTTVYQFVISNQHIVVDGLVHCGLDVYSTHCENNGYSFLFSQSCYKQYNMFLSCSVIHSLYTNHISELPMGCYHTKCVYMYTNGTSYSNE